MAEFPKAIWQIFFTVRIFTASFHYGCLFFKFARAFIMAFFEFNLLFWFRSTTANQGATQHRAGMLVQGWTRNYAMAHTSTYYDREKMILMLWTFPEYSLAYRTKSFYTNNLHVSFCCSFARVLVTSRLEIDSPELFLNYWAVCVVLLHFSVSDKRGSALAIPLFVDIACWAPLLQRAGLVASLGVLPQPCAHRLLRCELEGTLQRSSWPARSGSGTVCKLLDCLLIDCSRFFPCEINVIWTQGGRCTVFSFFFMWRSHTQALKCIAIVRSWCIAGNQAKLMLVLWPKTGVARVFVRTSTGLGFWVFFQIDWIE